MTNPITISLTRKREPVAEPQRPLVNAYQLAKEFGRNNVEVSDWLAKAETPVATTVPYGRGVMRLYDREVARAAVMDAIAAHPRKPVKPAPQAEDDLRADVQRLLEQNRILFKKLESMETALSALVRELGVKP